MSQKTYLSAKSSTRDASRRYRFNPMGAFPDKNGKCARPGHAYSRSMHQPPEVFIHAVPNGWFEAKSQNCPGSYGENMLPNVSQDHSAAHSFQLDPCFLRQTTLGTRDTDTEGAFSRQLGWIHSASTSTSIESTSITSTSEAARPRYLHHIDPNMIQVSASSTSRQILKSTRQRKRTVQLCPKFPKYEGLSRFAAPMNLLSRVPALPASGSDDVGSDKSVKKITIPFKPNLVPSDPNKLSSLVTNAAKDTTPPVEKGSTSVSEIPVDFLKNLSEEDWIKRQQTLEKMALERKDLLFKTGFSDASGKPFSPDEPSIETKPIPNRWVWYMRLSMDYDKMRGTALPARGPAAYLKYGWDRMGKSGKQPYQDLADVYSAQKVKMLEHLAEHARDLPQVKGPREEVVPKCLDHSVAKNTNSAGRPNSAPPPAGSDSDDMTTSSASLGEAFAYANVSSHEASSYSFRDVARTKSNAFQDPTLSLPIMPPMSATPDGLLTSLPSDTSICLPNSFNSPEFINLVTQEEFENSLQQPIFDQHDFHASMNWSLNSTQPSSHLALADQSTWNFLNYDVFQPFGSNVLESSYPDFHTPMSGENDPNEHLMVNAYKPLDGITVAENTEFDIDSIFDFK